jgi:tetratricopeptide (TPR) repeat protein
MRHLILTLALLLVPLTGISEEFTWSWDDTSTGQTVNAQGGPDAVSTGVQAVTTGPVVVTVQPPAVKEPDQPAPAPFSTPDTSVAPAPDAGAAAAPAKGNFAWSWEQDEAAAKAAPAAAPATQPAVIVEPAQSSQAAQPSASPAADVPPVARVAGRVNSAEYDEIVKENLELRRKIDEAARDKQSVAAENRRLERQVQDLTSKIEEAVAKINEIKKAGTGVDTAKVAEYEERINKAEAEKARLSVQLGELQKQAASAPAQPAAPAQPVVARSGSDLVVQIERENQQLKAELARIQSERQNVANVRDEMVKKIESARSEVELATERQKDMKERLDQTRMSEQDSRKAMDKLLDQVPALERDLAGLKASLAEKDRVLDAKTRESEDLKKEVQNRERRVRKLENMTELLEKAGGEVSKANNREMRDMHYNQGVVYAKEGRFQDAEREYLHALRIDPTDADVHFNLGILYDQSLKNKAKAVLHYRTYLKLNPYGADSDAVKQWLMQMDMDTK